MRFKLIIIVSIVVSIIGYAGTDLLLYLAFGSIELTHPRGFWLIAACLIPALVVLLGGFFIYRHTAKRRVLQALLSVVISVFIILSLFLVSVIVIRERPQRISNRSQFNSLKLDFGFSI